MPVNNFYIFTRMEEPVKNPLKQTIPSLIINAAMAVYALCTFIAALQAGVAWRILLSGTGLVFFTAAVAITVAKLLKMRKKQPL